MTLLRNNQGRIANHQLAELNDMAYRAVQKRGLQKKLDERAIKNQEVYKKLDLEVDELVKKMDFAELRKKY